MPAGAAPAHHARVAAAADEHTDPWAQLVAGSRAFLAISSDPAVSRILLVDAPVVLGWHDWRALDESASSPPLLHDTITGLIETGVIAPQPAEPLARLLSGAMNEAALWLAQAGTAANHAAAGDALGTTARRHPTLTTLTTQPWRSTQVRFKRARIGPGQLLPKDHVSHW